MFQPNAVQYGIYTPTVYVSQVGKPSPPPYTTAFDPGRVVLDGLYGSLDGARQSPTKLLPFNRRVEVRGRFDVTVRLAVQQNLPVGGWTEVFAMTGFEFGALVKLGPSGDVRLSLTGQASGSAEMLEV